MKKCRIFFKGSSAEKKFLEKQLKKGYLLRQVNCFVYRFEKTAYNVDCDVDIEFAKENDNLKWIKENQVVEKIIEKPLLLSDTKIIYSYLKVKPKTEILNDTHGIEQAYLNRLLNRIYLFNGLATIIPILIIGISIAVESFQPMPMTAVMSIGIVWVINVILIIKIYKRINQLGVDNTIYGPEITITIEDVQEKPNIEELRFLGNWRYVTYKNGIYYYRLISNFSSANIRDEVSNYLNIDRKKVKVISFYPSLSEIM